MDPRGKAVSSTSINSPQPEDLALASPSSVAARIPESRETPSLRYQDRIISLVLMAGPSSSLLAMEMDRDAIILQNFGVSYEELLFYAKLNTIGGQVCTSALPCLSRVRGLICLR